MDAYLSNRFSYALLSLVVFKYNLINSKMENEILEVEMELGNGSIKKMFIQEVDSSDWDEIEKGTKGLLSLINGQQMLIEINSADYEGVSFKIIGESQSFFYDEEVINSLFIEVEPNVSDN